MVVREVGNLANKKILIADDEARMRRLVEDFLKKEGYSVVEAADGRQARDAFRENRDIDLVILDVMMPEYDGWTVCREIRKSSQVPVIMLTARGGRIRRTVWIRFGSRRIHYQAVQP